MPLLSQRRLHRSFLRPFPEPSLRLAYEPCSLPPGLSFHSRAVPNKVSPILWADRIPLAASFPTVFVVPFSLCLSFIFDSPNSSGTCY